MSAQVHSASSTLMSGTPSTCTAQSAIRAVSRARPRGRGRCRRTPDRPRARSSAITIVPSGSSRPGPRRGARRGCEMRSPSSPWIRSASNARTATPVSTTATVSASSSDVAALEPAGAQALEHRRLARRAELVRVDPDLAEEDAIGGGDRLAAHGSAPAGRAHVRQVAQPLSQLTRAAARRRRGFRAAAGPDPGTPRAAQARPSRAAIASSSFTSSQSRPRSRASGRPQEPSRSPLQLLGRPARRAAIAS